MQSELKSFMTVTSVCYNLLILILSQYLIGNLIVV